MKLNWGHYIIISFVLFISLMLYMVVRSYQHSNDLVTEDYYAKELRFQEVIDKKTRATALTENISWESTKGGILISYLTLTQPIEGEILFFRPSDKNKDVIFKIEMNDKNQQFLIHNSFIHGKYLIQFEWHSGKEEYYTEGAAYILK